MMQRVRTTVNIDEHLLIQARRLALAQRRSLGDVIDDSLRTTFSRGDAGRRPGTTLPMDGEPANRPLIDLDDREAVSETLGDTRWPRADS